MHYITYASAYICYFFCETQTFQQKKSVQILRWLC